MKAFARWLNEKYAWSVATFGPGKRVGGVLAHIRKELDEVSAKPGDLTEWTDILLLAFDGALRQGYTGEEIVVELMAKQARNTMRDWPDWRLHSEDVPLQHVKTTVGAGGVPDPPESTLYPAEHFAARNTPCQCKVCRAVPTALVPRVD